MTDISKPSKSLPRGPRSKTIAVMAMGVALVLAVVLTGCMHSEGTPSLQRQNILSGSEIPEGLANCEYDDDFMDPDLDEDGLDPSDPESWEDLEFDLPMPREMGFQTLGPQGSEVCEEAEFMVMITMYTFANDRDLQVWAEYMQEDWASWDDDYDEEWEDDWGDEWADEWNEDWADPCAQALSGQNRLLMAFAFPMSFDWEEPDWEDWDEEDWENWEDDWGGGAGPGAEYLQAQDDVLEALRAKFPGMQDLC